MDDEAFCKAEGARFGVPKATIQLIIGLMIRGGEKGFGAMNDPDVVDFVIKRTLEHVNSGGCFAQFFPNIVETGQSFELAVCGASQRLCLWYRAHEVTNGDDLAKYFETAFAYFVEYWETKEVTAVQNALDAYPIRKKPKQTKSEKHKSRSSPNKSPSKLVNRSTTGNRAPMTLDRSGRPHYTHATKESSTSTSTSTSTSIQQPPPTTTTTTKTPTAHVLTSPMKLIGSEQHSKHSVTHTTKNTTKDSAVSKSDRVGALTKSSSTLCIDVEVNLPRRNISRKMSVIKGRCFEVSPSKPSIKIPKVEARWIQIGTGPQFSKSKQLLPRSGDQSLSPTHNTKQSFDTSSMRLSPVSDTYGSNYQLSLTELGADFDQDEASWWTKRYDGTTAVDFELEFSDAENTDDEMGDGEVTADAEDKSNSKISNE